MEKHFLSTNVADVATGVATSVDAERDANHATNRKFRPLARLHRYGTGSVSLLLDLFFPACCQACGSNIVDQAPQQRGFCTECEAEILSLDSICCLKCAMPAPACTAPPADCPACREEKFLFSETFALGPYRNLLRHLVLKSKNRAGLAAARSLGQLLGQHHARRLAPLLKNHQAEVVPVPGHWTRRLSRGGNGPDAIAAGLAESLGIGCQHHLVRTRRTPKQVEIAPSRRAANVRRAFRVKRPVNIQGKLLLLVDDVFTTGSTLSSATRELMRQGAEQVIVVVPAKRVNQL